MESHAARFQNQSLSHKDDSIEYHYILKNKLTKQNKTKQTKIYIEKHPRTPSGVPALKSKSIAKREFFEIEK